MSCNERPEQEIKADIAALKAAIASGISSYSYDGRAATYRSLDEMKEGLASLENELAESEGVEKNRRAYAMHSRGY